MKENEKQAHVQGAIALCHSLLSALHQETVTDLTFDPYAHIVKATSRKRQVVAARKNSKLLMSFIEKIFEEVGEVEDDERV